MDGIALSIDAAEAARLSTAIRRFAAETGRDLGKTVREAARGLGVQLSAATFPKLEEQGQAAVGRDIRKVFADAPGAWRMIREKDGENSASAFWKAAVAAGSRGSARLTSVLARSTVSGASFGALDPALHAAARTGRRTTVRRAAGKPALILPVRSTQLKPYIEKIQRRVGLAKAGWAAALKSLGLATRGIPAWAGTGRHKLARGRGRETGMDGENPSVELTNGTPWISEVLNEGGYRLALKVTADRLTVRHEKELRIREREAARAITF